MDYVMATEPYHGCVAPTRSWPVFTVITTKHILNVPTTAIAQNLSNPKIYRVSYFRMPNLSWQIPEVSFKTI